MVVTGSNVQIRELLSAIIIALPGSISILMIIAKKKKKLLMIIKIYCGGKTVDFMFTLN
jgi:hypothetical protein